MVKIGGGIAQASARTAKGRAKTSNMPSSFAEYIRFWPAGVLNDATILILQYRTAACLDLKNPCHSGFRQILRCLNAQLIEIRRSI